MIADHFRKTGADHHFCQDYSAVSQNYAIVSDGCSSALDSDIGAMLLTRAAKACLNTKQSVNIDVIIEIANLYRQIMEIDIKALSATLLTVVADQENFVATISGDGFIVAHNKETGLEWLEVEFTSGAPYYPRYSLYNGLEGWLKEFPGEMITRGGFQTNRNYEELFPLDLAPSLISFSFPFDKYNFVGVGSDGIRSFYKKEISETSIVKKPIPASEIIQEVFGFKNINGEFVQRRCQRAFEKFAKENWFNGDDFSIAAVSLGDAK